MMNKILVTYFSASGVTRNLAQRIAHLAGADLWEIEPREVYTAADLDWTNKNSRSSVEMADRTARPALKQKIDLKMYSHVLVGFPIWWYREPSIVDTFMEAHDLTDKVVVPFATSGGSGMGDSTANLQALAPRARVVAGKRFAAQVSDAELINWIKTWL